MGFFLVRLSSFCNEGTLPRHDGIGKPGKSTRLVERTTCYALVGFRTSANCSKKGSKSPCGSLTVRTHNLVSQSKYLVAGFTLVEAIIVCALVGLLGAIAIPSYLRSRDAAHRSTCINNLKQIDSAIEQWATEHRQPQNAAVDFSDIHPYLKGVLVCPSGGTSFSDSYTLSTVADLPVCQKDPRNHIWLGSALDVAAKPK